MAVRKISDDILAVGAIDWDRRLFDELIPLPYGTSYNAYLVKGQDKIALLDTVDPAKTERLLRNIKEANVDKIDYIVAHHAEQDHSGSISAVLQLYPEAKVVTSTKAKKMLMDLLLLSEEHFIAVEDKETLSLGNKTLEFHYTPWVHWPETMVTYLPEDKILFSCDFLGSHIATSDLFVPNEYLVYNAAKTYFAEIMMPFRTKVAKNLERIEELQPEIIAPSHGPVYDRPQFIIDAYKDWTSDTVKNEVVIPYVSMHGSTEAMVNYLVDALIEREVGVTPFNLTETDLGSLAESLVDAATIIIAAPTLLVGPHPAAVYAAYLANALRPKAKFASIIGSYGWGSKMVDNLTAMLPNLKVELLEPVIVKGFPKKENFEALIQLAEKIQANHQKLNL